MNRVLIVEDNINQCTFLEKILHENYSLWEICTAASYDGAIALLDNKENSDHPFTLFLLDVQLSTSADNTDGFQLANYLRSQPPYYRTPIIFLTGILDAAVFAMHNYHCYNYITKPYTESDVVNQLEQLLISGYLDKTINIVDTKRIQHMIIIENIQFIKSERHHIYIYDDHSKYISRQYTLTQIEQMLPSYFIRCHNRYIFNKKYMKNIDFTAKYIYTRDFHFPFSKKYTDVVYKLCDTLNV